MHAGISTLLHLSFSTLIRSVLTMMINQRVRLSTFFSPPTELYPVIKPNLLYSSLLRNWADSTSSYCRDSLNLLVLRLCDLYTLFVLSLTSSAALLSPTIASDIMKSNSTVDAVLPNIHLQVVLLKTILSTFTQTYRFSSKYILH